MVQGESKGSLVCLALKDLPVLKALPAHDMEGWCTHAGEKAPVPSSSEPGSFLKDELERQRTATEEKEALSACQFIQSI